MKYFIIAGESSGDLHGAALIRCLRDRDPGAEIQCWGGNRMEQAGAALLKHYRELDFMGFWEVISNLPTIIGHFRSCKKNIRSFDPDALVLIDYPGFNLRMAKWARKQSLKVFYYISPQLWAWKEGRVKTVKKCVDRMFVILPFEQDFYAKHDVDVSYVGHPLLDVIEEYSTETSPVDSFEHPDQRIVALLPGSRKQEIKRLLPIMIRATEQLSNYTFLLAAVPHHDSSFYEDFIPADFPLEVVVDGTYDILSVADAAIVASGTASLETALFDVPEVVVYKGNIFSYWIARYLVHVDYISLVNLILDRPLITELIQSEVTPNTVRRALNNLFLESRRKKIKRGYRALKELLGTSGAAQLVAGEIIERTEA